VGYQVTRALGLCLMAIAATAGAAETAQRQYDNQTTPQTTYVLEDLSRDGVVTDLAATRDTDKFNRNIARAAAAVDYESIHDFVAIGASTNHFSQGAWSLRVNSIEAAVRKVDRRTGEGVFARLGATTSTHRTYLHGEGTWNKRLTDSTGLELVANRDAVESQEALQRAILANFVGVSIDHAATDRLTLIGMPTYRRFSDGNEQIGIRGWGVYTLLPDSGLSLMVHARTYESTQNGGGAYFSPDQYDRVEAGFRLRRGIAGWRVFAIANAGRERIDRDIEKPTNHLSLTATRIFSGDVSVGVQLVRFQATGDNTLNVGSAGHYVWRMARVYLGIPLR
jgi:hypothetical protein